MAFDQDITYRVNIDDTNFQARLTQLRASMDTAITGGMSSGFNQAAAMAMMTGGGGGNPINMGGGLADYGSQLRPITYTPAAIAMQPHFGMAQIQQTLGQAGLGTLGPVGGMMYSAGSAVSGFLSGGVAGALNARPLVPYNMSSAEYYQESARAFGGRMGDVAAMTTAAGGIAALSTGGMVAGGALAGKMFAGTMLAGPMGFVGAMAGAAVGSTIGAPAVEAYKENVAIQEALQAGSFRFISGDSPDVDVRRGRGFSTRAQAQVAEGIQQMELHDTRYGMQEYRQVLEAGMQMGAFAGTKDATDFQNKFKGLLETVKTISSTLHTSIKEATEYFRGFQDIGVTDPTQMQRMVLSSEAAGRASGRTGAEMVAIGQQGAELFRGTGISMDRGFELNQLNTMAIRLGLQNGTISREMVAQAGGENAFAQRQTAGVLSAFQTTMGRGMLMSAYDPATQSLNADALLRPGSAQGMMMRAAGLGTSGIIGLEARQEELISQLSPMQMRMAAINQSTVIAQTLVGGGYTKNFEDAFIYAGRMQGKSIEEIKADLSFIKTDPEKFKADQEVGITTVQRQAALESIDKNRFSKRAYNFIREKLYEGPKQSLLDMRTSVKETFESIGDALDGVARADAGLLSKEVQDIAKRATGGSDDFGIIEAEESGISGIYRNLIGGQTTKAQREKFSGAQATDTQIEVPDPENPGQSKKVNTQMVKAGNGQALVFKSPEEAAAFKKENNIKEGFIGLGKTTVKVGNREEEVYLYQRASDVKKEADANRENQISEQDRKNAENIKIRSHIVDRLSAEVYRAGEGGMSLDAATSALYKGKKFSDLKGADKAVVEKYLKEMGPAAARAMKEMQESGDNTAISAAVGAAREKASDQFKEARGEFESLIKKAGFYGMFGGVGLNSQAALQKLDAGELVQLLSADTDEAKGNVLRTVGARHGVDKIRTAMKELGNLTPEEKAKMKGSVDTMQKNAAAVGQVSATTQGDKADTTAAVVGDISKSTMEQIDTMSKQLIANYKILLEYQKMLEGKLLQQRG